MKIPLHQQRLQSNPVEVIKAELKLGRAVSGEKLLLALENSIGRTLPTELRDLFARFSAPAVKRRGRPQNNRAKEDFAMEELDRKYRDLLSQISLSKVPHADGPPSEQAYRQLAAEMVDDFGPIDWRALNNKHSAWRNGCDHRAHGLVDSEDFDAAIERQFPAQN